MRSDGHSVYRKVALASRIVQVLEVQRKCGAEGVSFFYFYSGTLVLGMST